MDSGAVRRPMKATLEVLRDTPFYFSDNYSETSFIHDYMTKEAWYADENLLWYEKFYHEIHVYISIIACLLGIFGNMATVFVLTRKRMASSTNTILKCLAVVDTALLLCYVPVSLHDTLNSYFGNNINSKTDFNIYASGNFSKFQTNEEDVSNLNIKGFLVFMEVVWAVLHSIATWITAVAALWRYVYINYYVQAKNWLTNSEAIIAVVTTCLACVLINTIEYLRHTIYRDTYFKEELLRSEDGTVMFATKKGLLAEINVWLIALFLNLIPCLIIFMICVCLVAVLYRVKRGRVMQNLKSSTDKKNNKVTKMLLGVMCFFLLTHLPYGIIFLVSESLNVRSFHQILLTFSETAEFLALLNSSTKVLIYYSLNSEFRKLCSWHIFIKWCKNEDRFLNVRGTLSMRSS